MYLTNAFLKGADWTEAEIIHIAKKDIKNCLGCFSCWNKTPRKCIIKDSMSEILTKIVVADVIIWSFPLYYFSVPGSLKNFIDRQLPLSLPFMEESAESGGHPSRYDFLQQKHIIISTCGFSAKTRHQNSRLYPFFELYWQQRFKRYCGRYPWICH